MKTKLLTTLLLLCLGGVFHLGKAAVASPEDLNQQPQTTIRGTITDAVTGEAVIGASVVQKGTPKGVVTDLDGNFEITVPAGTVLEISSIGYRTQEIVAQDRGPVRIQLEEDVLGLEESIAIGYGTARKKDLTGSVVRADINTFRESPNVNIVSSLQGAVAGLNVGAANVAGEDPEMSIRGRTSISGAQTPLIVLDGVIYRGTMSDLNPNDIESIDVLKDASATAIYGSQAAAGVLMITTKNVKSITKPIIEYSGSYSFQQPVKVLKPTNAAGYLQHIADAHLSESRTGTDMTTMNPSFNYAGYLTQNNAAEQYGYEHGIDTDWYDICTNAHPYINSHNVSLRGRSELNSYFVSLGYTDQQNVTLNDGLKRYNVRANFDARVTDWMKVGMQAFFTLSDTSGAVPSRTMLIKASPLISPYLLEEGQQDTYRTFIYNVNVNPFLLVDCDDLKQRNNLSATFFADIDIPFVRGLNYRLNASQNLISSKAFYYSDYDVDQSGYGYKDYDNSHTWSVDNILSYKRSFGRHDVNLTAVYGAEKRTGESTHTLGQQFANGVLGYNYLDASSASRRTIGSVAWQETSLYSMLRAAYSYDNRYYLTATVRRDGFSGFGLNNKIGVFPSVAISWNITNENFMQGTRNYLDLLKLRASWGVSGNRSLERYQTLATLESADQYLYGDGGAAEKGSYIASLSNADLRWETTATFNLGLDFSFLGSRLYGSIEAYKAKTSNLLYDVTIPTINYGLNSMSANIGSLENRGVELTLTGVPVRTRDFSWTITGNFSLNRNKVLSILGIDADGDGVEDDLVSSKIFIGEPFGVNYDYNKLGIYSIADYQENKNHMYGTYIFEDIDGNEKITDAADRKILSYQDPSYRFSVQNVFRYKSWELKVFINSIQGGKKWYRAQSANNNILTSTSVDYNLWDFDYWTPENPNATYRQLGDKGMDPNGKFVPYIDRSFVRLQDLTLSYSIPQHALNRIRVNDFKVFVTGKNLLTFTKWDGLDPETGDGYSESAYPVMKSVSMGVNFSF